MKTNTAIILMVIVTVLTSSGQVLWKIGSADLALTVQGLLNIPIIIGLVLYACGVLLLMYALKGGDVSLLYPILALSYVWVSLISKYYFHENFNLYKILGVLVIILGVAVLARANNTQEVPA